MRWIAALSVGVLLGAVALPVSESLLRPSIAHAAGDTIDDLAVGEELVAVADVQLQKASIAKGSHVSVLKLDRRDGRIASVDVELADGHVVPRVQANTIRSLFRVAAE